MKLTNHEGLRVSGMLGLLLIELCLLGLGSVAHTQTFSTTTVQGTVYLANGQPGTGTLVVSWPSFTTASGQVVAADSTTVAIAPDGFVSVNLAPNQGASPAGLYYTATYYMSDGSTSTQYWVVPATTTATLGQVQARLMPSTQAVQAVSKTYVDQAIANLAGGVLTVTGATLTGPLTLCCDPTTPMQAADKRYVDASVALDVPLTGGTLTGPLTATKLGAVYQVDQFAGADFGAKLGACLSGLSSTQGGTCDARNFSGTLAMGSNLTISTGNATVLLPCATISTANQVVVTAGTRNVSLRGCALRGTSTASGSQGGTVFYYSGTGAMVKVGDPTYAADTRGFHLDNAAINTTLSTSASAQGFAAYRTQELNLESLYFLGNSNQTGMTLDGTGNYTGGTFYDNQFIGFQTAVNAIGHQVTNAATTDWVNASTFVRLHIDCPTSSGSPISGTYGINLQQGDGNTFTGGDVEGCATALHLGANAQNNTIVGLRNENSTNQVVADAGSAYNSWMTGGTMFTGQLTDNGTRNSFLDTFHRSFNGLNGDWYGSQADATVTNHYRLGIGTGNERGLLNRYQSDYGYRWTTGLSDATAGEQFYQIQDELNNVYRLSIGQYNHGQSSTNNQTVINAAGTGAVVLNGSNNSGTGGVVFGSGGASETTVATINNAGNAQFNGTLQVGGTSTLVGTPTVKNQADAEIDAILWAGLTTSQKESFIYKDWNGNSQWYMVKDASNNWALNSATGGLDSFKAYQSTNSGDTYINASNSSGVVRVNYETGAGTGFKVYGGNSGSLYASFTGTTAIQFPGLAASSGHNCLQIDNSGYVTNTGSACGSGSSSGTVNSGTSGQIAYYNGTGTVLSGTSTVAVTAGGTGASTATGALANLGGAALTGATFTGALSTTGSFSTANNLSIGPRFDVTNAAFGAKGDGNTDDTLAIQAAFNACANYVSSTNSLTGHYGGIVEFPGLHSYVISSTINAYDGCHIEGTTGNSGGGYSPPRILWYGTTAGTVYTITGFTAAANTTPLYTLSSPAPVVEANLATFTVSGSSVPAVGQWVDIEGLSTSAGTNLNRLIAQVAAASGSTFTVVFPSPIIAGTFTDSGIATTVNVMIAFDPNAHFQAAISNISLADVSTTLNSFQVGFYFGSRVDTGTHMEQSQVSGASMYSYYFANGGINVDFDKGWRSDGAGIAGIYWRVGAQDSFGIANGTTDNSRAAYGSLSSGAAVMLDNSECITGGSVHFTARNIKHEINTTIGPGLGVYTLLDCPINPTEQFFIDLENVWMTPGPVANSTGIVMSPANDAALNLSIVNGIISGASLRWVGLPQLTRNDLGGGVGSIPLLSYAPPFTGNTTSGAIIGAASPTQIVDDLNITRLYQYGIQASDFLYSDTAFAALPNGTTLYAGQILAPPSYWSGANGKRYALDVVYQTGTTGTPNGGNTTCATPIFTITGVSVSNNIATFTGTTNGLWNGTQPYITDSVLFPSGTPSYSIIGNSLTSSSTSFSIAYTHANLSQTADTGTATQGYELVCNSATDLSMGQQLLNTSYTAVGYGIVNIDATYPSSVFLRVAGNISGGFSTPATLNFFPPVLGPELQLPTKSSAAPTALAWSQGDIEQNSGATANGVAAWVNVAAGTPGTWAGIPLGNSSGQIAVAQITGLGTAATANTGTSGGTIPLLNGTNTASGAWTFNNSSFLLSGLSGLPSSGKYCLDIGTTGQVYVTSADCGTGSGGLSGMTAGQVAVAGSASTITSSMALQGTDTKLLTAGTVSGTATPLCTDANGGATTTGCPIVTSTAAIFNTVTITSYTGTLATGGNTFTNGTVALSHNSTTTINVSGLVNGASFNLRLNQDSTGGNTLTLGTGCTWLAGTNSGFVASTTPALSAAANGINVLSAIYDGTNCLYNVR